MIIERVFIMYGIVLEGGGAKGSYQLGAWKALKELGIEYNGVVGTSIGSINATLMIQNDLKAAYELWENIDSAAPDSMEKDFYHKLADHKFSTVDPFKIKEEIKNVFGIEGIDITPFRKAIHNIVKEETIRKAKKDFGLVTISLKQKKGLKLFKEDIPNGQLADYVVASCYFPIYKTIELNGDYFLDGSYYDRLPTEMLINKGYKNIIEIRLYPSKKENKPADSDINIITIEPSEYLGKTMNFNKKSIMKNIKLGYFDTIRVFKDLKGKKYYIDSNMSEEDLSQKLRHLSEPTIDAINKLLFIKQASDSNMRTDDIIKTIIQKLSLNENSSYETLVLEIFEYLAEKFHIERFNIYTDGELLDLIKEKSALFLIGDIKTKQEDKNLIKACIEIIKDL